MRAAATVSSITGEFCKCPIANSAHNSFFSERTVEVLQQTPSGELVFVGDERRLWELLDKDR
jgi:hypothetical protein